MTNPAPLKRCLCIPALSILAIGAIVATTHQTTTEPLDVTVTAARPASSLAPVGDLAPPPHPATVAAREAGFAADRARMADWARDGAQAKADSDARLAAEAAAEAERAARPVTNHEHISPPLGGSKGGGSIGSSGDGWVSSGCNAPGPPPPDYIKQRESGGDYGLNDPNGHYGAWQFAPSTWAGVGGSGNPADASPAEQDCRAAMLWDNGNGRSHWAATA